MAGAPPLRWLSRALAAILICWTITSDYDIIRNAGGHPEEEKMGKEQNAGFRVDVGYHHVRLLSPAVTDALHGLMEAVEDLCPDDARYYAAEVVKELWIYIRGLQGEEREAWEKGGGPGVRRYWQEIDRKIKESQGEA